MNFLLLSDLHYGFSSQTHRIIETFLKDDIVPLIEKYDVKLVVIAGDIMSHRQLQLDECCALLRQYIHVPIAVVRGNHDFWDCEEGPNKGRMSWDKLQKQHKAIFAAHKIHHLEQRHLMVDGFLVVGYDGWYKSFKPATNDIYNMAPYAGECPMMPFQSGRAWKELGRVLACRVTRYKKAICVTHHCPFTMDMDFMDHVADPDMLDPLLKKFDILCVAHTHRRHVETAKDCLIVNCGSDYENPKFLLIDADSQCIIDPWQGNH